MQSNILEAAVLKQNIHKHMYTKILFKERLDNFFKPIL